jgi:hypothetical protein
MKNTATMTPAQRQTRRQVLEVIYRGSERIRIVSPDGRHDLIASPLWLRGGYVGGDEGQRIGYCDSSLTPRRLRALLGRLIRKVVAH